MNNSRCIVTIIFVMFIANGSSGEVRLCSPPIEYYNILSPNCHYDPDADDTPVNIIRRWGCTVEEYNLTTPDGYIISLIKANKSASSTNSPILMIHGIFMNSRAFLSYKEKSLAYGLLNNGYEVYFINLRGTKYSTGTTNGLTQSDYTYWKFSWHQMGIYDIATALDHIYSKTGRRAIVVGYSMGTTAVAVYLSLLPERAKDRVKAAILMSPVIAVDSSIPSILARFAPFWKFIQPFAKLLFNGKIFGNDNELKAKFCSALPITMAMCYSEVVLVYGINYGGLDYSRRPVSIHNTPDAISENVVTHYSQIITSGIFQQMDYGTKENQIAYNGSSTPPVYPVKDINVLVSVVFAENDWLAPPEVALKFWGMLPNSSKCQLMKVNDSQFAHDSFLNNVHQLDVLTIPLITHIGNVDSGSCA